MLFEPYVRFSSGGWMAAYWGIAAHSAYDVFSWYKCPSVILVFSHPSVNGVGFLSDCAISCSLPTCIFL